jgi:hypothetical protein
MIGQRALHKCETGAMVPQKMIDMTTFLGLSDCLALHFLHAVHREFRKLCMMCVIPQHSFRVGWLLNQIHHKSNEASRIIDGMSHLNLAVVEAPMLLVF